MISHEEILKALNWRYAVKVFDPSKKVSEVDLKSILESARLAPSSLGLEAWKFLVIENSELRMKIRAAAWDQTKVTDASHLIVLARRTDVREKIVDETLARASKIQGVSLEVLSGYKNMISGGITGKSDVELDTWIRSQTYIALGMMMETAALLDVDACPMEGFDAKQVDEILGLKEKNLASTSILAIGYRGVDEAASRPKVRRAFEEVIEIIK